jgi:MoaA/NifB/PqqE/SkfB family radical SAM enzyme
VDGAYDKAMKTLDTLQEMGVCDLGFGITVSDQNSSDLLPLFEMANRRNLEFAIAAVHNGYYFFKEDNCIQDKDRVADEFEKLVDAYLRTYRPKNWFRAYMAAGIINYVHGKPRPLPCKMGTLAFFLDPYGEVKPCNVMDASMGNLREGIFDELWNSKQAQNVRCRVASCGKHCWMVGSVSPVMRKHILRPIAWIVKNQAARRLMWRNGTREK